MLKADIRVMGTDYKEEQMFVDLVERCYGFQVTDDNGWIYTYEVGDGYRDGRIVNCFVHYESDCVFMVVECNGVYFEVGFDNYKEYKVHHEPLPFK